MNRRCWLYEDLHMPEMRASPDPLCGKQSGADLHQVQEAHGAAQAQKQDGVGGGDYGSAGGSGDSKRKPCSHVAAAVAAFIRSTHAREEELQNNPMTEA